MILASSQDINGRGHLHFFGPHHHLWLHRVAPTLLQQCKHMACLLCVPIFSVSTQLGTVNVKRKIMKHKAYHDLLPGSPPLSKRVTLSSSCFPAFRPPGPTRLPKPLCHKNQYYRYIHTYQYIYISYLHRWPVLWPVPGFQIFNQAFQTLVGGVAHVALSLFAKVCHQQTLFKAL